MKAAPNSQPRVEALGRNARPWQEETHEADRFRVRRPRPRRLRPALRIRSRQSGGRCPAGARRASGCAGLQGICLRRKE